jgi:hypothetical protein
MGMFKPGWKSGLIFKPGGRVSPITAVQGSSGIFGMRCAFVRLHPIRQGNRFKIE